MVAIEQTQQQSKGKTYTYQSKPKAIGLKPVYQIQYTDNERQGMYGNIMYDRRVIRGNTFRHIALPFLNKPTTDPIESRRTQECRRRAMARARAQEELRLRSPLPIGGRRHIELQTELYLEAVCDRIEQADARSQTDDFLDRPPTPFFIPDKSGKDVETQIYAGDIFDFKYEVRPMLEVMIAKTIEQSTIEALEEEELANLRQQQCEFEEFRNTELVEMQRLEEVDRRHHEEKQRRIEQQKEALEKDRETADKIAARSFARSYLVDLLPSVFSTLRVSGYFFDPIERDIEECFLPELVDDVTTLMENNIVARTVLDGLIREICLERLELYAEEDTTPPSPPHVVTEIDFCEVEEGATPFLQGENFKCPPIPLIVEPEYTYEGSC